MQEVPPFLKHQTYNNPQAASIITIDGSDSEAVPKLEALVAMSSQLRVVDEIDSQIRELFWIRHPMLDPEDADAKKTCAAFIQNYKPAQSWQAGRWVYWPWRHTLAHLLNETDLLELRTARNRNLITSDEQQRFRHAKVAVAGLSVGNAVAVTMTVLGGPQQLHLADFDTLEGSNLNRIRTGWHSLGLLKTQVTANEILEIDPDSQLTLFNDGITEDNIDEFLNGVDVCVDEIDDLRMKILLRVHCREKGIPVVMVTDNGDGVLLSVERYDQDSSYPFFHGSIPEDELLSIPSDMPRQQLGGMIARLVGVRNTMPRMIESLMQIRRTLFTWPQLGGAALLGGVAVAYAVRCILCDLPIRNGQWAISPEALCDPTFDSPQATENRNTLYQNFEAILSGTLPGAGALPGALPGGETNDTIHSV